ncbi:hypothetical protein AMTRI_Chr05g71210 [Amborella trichopoda]
MGESTEPFLVRQLELTDYAISRRRSLICVIENLISHEIVAIGSVFAEKKFIRSTVFPTELPNLKKKKKIIRSCEKAGEMVVNYLLNYARSAGCYKVLLNCDVATNGFMISVDSRRRVFKCRYIFYKCTTRYC